MEQTPAVSDSPASILRDSASAAGLVPELVPFVRANTLAESLDYNPFLMAPMAGVSDAAYRIMARAGGAALAYSEMVSVSGIHYAGSKTWDLALPADDEPDIAVQLFGREPELFREAACAVRERLGNKLALIDINMACPVPKVVKKGEGSALLDEPERAAVIVRACRDAGECPVTVKMRIGRTPSTIVAPSFARVLEEAGVSAVGVHGRCASQLYRGQADWDQLRAVVRAVSVPVIASGDIFDAHAAVSVLEQTGARAVFIARGSYGYPWIFAQARALRETAVPIAPSFEARLAAFELHLRLLSATGAHIARARSLAAWYVKGLPYAADFRREAMECACLGDFLELITRVRVRVESWNQEQGGRVDV